MFRNIPIHLIIFVIVAMAPVAKAIIEKLAKKRQQAQAEAQLQKQTEERLRTGRVTDASPTAAPMSAEAAVLAARRRAQLEELRRRGKARTTQQGGGVILSIPGSTGPTVPPAPPRARPQARPPQPRPTRSGRPAVPPPIRTAPRQAPPSRPVTPPVRPAPRTPVPSGPATSRLPAEAPAARAYEEPAPRRGLAEIQASAPASKPPADSALDVHTAAIADWRRAIIMREILDPPMALRPDILE